MGALRTLLSSRPLSAGIFICCIATAIFAAPPAFPPPALSPSIGRLDPTADPPQTEPIAIDREYDRFQDKSTIKVEGIRPLVTRGESRIFINATSSFDGVEITIKPNKVAINLMAVSEDFQYVDLHDGLQFILLINNKRVRVPAKFLKAGTTRDHNPKSIESFVAIVDAEVLVGMATAESVEAQLGATEFKLGAMEQLSLRKFAEAVNLVAPLPKATTAVLDDVLTTGSLRPDAVALHLAQAKVDEAQEKVDQLTRLSMQRLEESPQYSAAVKATRELEEKKDKTPAGSQRGEISQQWLEAKAKVSLIKSSALLENEELSSARRALADVQTALRTLQRSMNRTNIPATPR